GALCPFGGTLLSGLFLLPRRGRVPPFGGNATRRTGGRLGSSRLGCILCACPSTHDERQPLCCCLLRGNRALPQSDFAEGSVPPRHFQYLRRASEGRHCASRARA